MTNDSTSLNVISCPTCETEIEVGRAFHDNLRNQIRVEEREQYAEKSREIAKREKELGKVAASVEQMQQDVAKKVAEGIQKEKACIAKEAEEKAKESFQLDLDANKATVDELKKQVADARKNELSLLKQREELENTKANLELESKKQIAKERDAIKQAERKRIAEENRLQKDEADKTIVELNKKLADQQRNFVSKGKDLETLKETLDNQAKSLAQQELELQKKVASKLAESKKSLIEQARRDAEEGVQIELETSIKKAGELRKQLSESKKAQLELVKEQEKLQLDKESLELESKKQIAKEREAIQQAERKRVLDDVRLEQADKEKTITDLTIQIDNLQRKARLGSQQSQGEVLELDVEATLKQEFPFDEIEEIRKGQRGADVQQSVRNHGGRLCGSILFETKRVKNWNDEWLTKLRDDQRAAGANYAVIVSEVLPKHVNNIAFEKGVWICSRAFVVSLTTLLRQGLVDTAKARTALQGRDEKKDRLFSYILGHEFPQRVLAVFESYDEMKKQVDRERTAFNTQWKKRERLIERGLLNMSELCGDLAGLSGLALPGVEQLNLLENPDDDDSSSRDAA